jgi:S-adenosylmethionine:tRNA ribosyltransferase-isomerase
MLISEFDFDLPEQLIALRPMVPREAARLLDLSSKTLVDRTIADLPKILKSGDMLIINDTKVLPTQLKGTRDREGQTAHFEATLIKSINGQTWQAFIKPGRRIKLNDKLRFASEVLTASVTHKDKDGVYSLTFDQSVEGVIQGLHKIGSMPLPPYIRSKRPEDLQDHKDYQTVFAKEEGSVAAPTAGLHFTPELLETLKQKGVLTEAVTLHVGAGTFLPVKVDDTKDHKMHAEFGIISHEAASRINAARGRGGRIVSVGTTSLRLLESACDDQGIIHPFAAETDIFLTPGLKIRSADMLMTNFHLPKSTLFMLVCAFSGTERMKSAYDHAIKTQYRFFSYGDACLLSNCT